MCNTFYVNCWLWIIHPEREKKDYGQVRTQLMSVSLPQLDREAWCAVVHGVAESDNWATEVNPNLNKNFHDIVFCLSPETCPRQYWAQWVTKKGLLNFKQSLTGLISHFRPWISPVNLFRAPAGQCIAISTDLLFLLILTTSLWVSLRAKVLSCYCK